MIRLLRALVLAALLLHPLSMTVGAQGADPPSESAVVATYVDGVVVPTYTLLAQRLGTLKGAITTLRQAPTDANLQAARDAFLAARQPWEWSESFLFGPVSSLGLDPALDTWPISEDNLKDLLAGSTPLSAAAVADLEPEIKGYHSLERGLGSEGAASPAPRDLPAPIGSCWRG